MKRIVFTLFLSMVLAASVNAEQKLKKLTLSGPFASVSNPLIHMVDTGALLDIAEEVVFKVWKTPDQLRASALSGDADFIAMPSNVAANLYNRGVELKLVNISVWGILFMVSREDGLTTLADFKGKEIAMPFREDMPDIIFTQLARAQGLDPEKDFKLRYVSNPLDALKLLLTRRIDHVLLAEPAISMALRKSKSFPVNVIAPDLYRSVDLQSEWARLLKREDKIPQAGMVALGAVLDRPDVVARFETEYKKSLQWTIDNPIEAGELVASTIELITPEAVADSIAVTRFEATRASDAREELEFFYQRLLDENPALVGGKLPDMGFYY